MLGYRLRPARLRHRQRRGQGFGSLGSFWQGFGVGDFSGNGNESDVLLHNASTGALYFLDVLHSKFDAGDSRTAGAIGTEWQLLGVGDFSGNSGESDVAIRDGNTGAVDLLDVQRNQFVAPPISIGGIGMEWQILGVGDFSSNANETDILMRDIQNGAIDVFDVQNSQFVGPAITVGGIGTEWQALGVGDFSGNMGETDLAMRDTQTGAIYVFNIQHNEIVGSHPLGGVGIDWQNLGVGSPLTLGSPLV